MYNFTFHIVKLIWMFFFLLVVKVAGLRKLKNLNLLLLQQDTDPM